MTSRERVFAALDHREPDRVPVDFWCSPEAFGKLKTHYHCSTNEEILDRMGADLRYIEGPSYNGPDLTGGSEGTDRDIWGVLRKAAVVGEGEKKSVIKSVCLHPLAEIETVDQAEQYDHWPSPDWYDYGVVASQCDEYLKREKVTVFEGDRTNRVAQLKTYIYIRGTENTFTDMVLKPELFRYIVGRIRGFYREYATRILEAADGRIDIFMTGDDFGAQNGLLISREMWLDFLSTGFEEYMKLIGQGGAVTMHHSCGAVAPIITDMVDRGLCVLQSLQPEATGMDGALLKKEFGDAVCFNGSLSIQKTLPFGSPADIRLEVINRVETLATAGGFIIGTAHKIQADTPLENLLALETAYRECLWY